MDAKMAQLGLFVIISSENLPTSEILPLYYTRQQVEQVFDVSKNNADILPIRVQNEDTFRGHLILAFLATVVIQKLQRDIITKRKKSDKVYPEGVDINYWYLQRKNILIH
jgi:transposase